MASSIFGPTRWQTPQYTGGGKRFSDLSTAQRRHRLNALGVYVGKLQGADNESNVGDAPADPPPPAPPPQPVVQPQQQYDPADPYYYAGYDDSYMQYPEYGDDYYYYGGGEFGYDEGGYGDAGYGDPYAGGGGTLQPGATFDNGPLTPVGQPSARNVQALRQQLAPLVQAYRQGNRQQALAGIKQLLTDYMGGSSAHPLHDLHINQRLKQGKNPKLKALKDMADQGTMYPQPGTEQPYYPPPAPTPQPPRSDDGERRRREDEERRRREDDDRRQREDNERRQREDADRRRREDEDRRRRNDEDRRRREDEDRRRRDEDDRRRRDEEDRRRRDEEDRKKKKKKR